MARVCVCGSMTHIDRIEALGEVLREGGHEVRTPKRDDLGLDWSTLSLEQQIARKTLYIREYQDEIRTADVILIANFPKHGVAGYVGANSLMEAAVASALGAPVVFLNEMGPQPCRLEAAAVMTHCLNGDPDNLNAILAETAESALQPAV